MGFEPQPEKLDIVFMPVPEPWQQKHKGWKWEVLLNPVRASPGSPARVKVSSSQAVAKIEVKRMKDRLREVCQMEKWTFSVRPLRDESDRYGIWATYKGIYTTAEWQDELIQRQQYRERALRAAKKRAAKRAMQESLGTVSLLRPNPGRG